MKKLSLFFLFVFTLVIAVIAYKAYQDRKVLRSWKDVVAFQSVKANWKSCESHSDCKIMSPCTKGLTAINKEYWLEFKTYHKKRAELANRACVTTKPDIDLKPACHAQKCQLASVGQGVEDILGMREKPDSDVQQSIMNAHGLACRSDAVARIVQTYDSRMFQCSAKQECTIAQGGCGNKVPINKNWKETYEFLSQNATACKSCSSFAPLLTKVDCYENRCVPETDTTIAAEHVLTVDFLPTNEFVFYSDFWTVALPIGGAVGYDEIVPMANTNMQLPTITFNADKSMVADKRLSIEFGKLPIQWTSDREGRLIIGNKTFRYDGRYRAFFSPFQENENLGLYIIRKDRIADFKHIKSYSTP